MTPLHLLFPVRCPCGSLGRAPCYGCVTALQRSLPFTLAGLDSATAVYQYEGAAQALVHAFKFSRQRSLATWASTMMAATVSASIPPAEKQAMSWLVTWVPASREGKAHRGFDQGELLARSVARRLQLPARATLTTSDGRRQTGAERSVRLERSGFGLRARSKRKLETSRVGIVLIDDIVTTGATMMAAAETLRSAGVDSIHGGALARADRSVHNT